MSEVVKLERHDNIAVVTVNSPPVNALSAAVRGGIFDCVKSAIDDAQVQGIVLTCAGRTFIAGADITEFGKPPKPPGLAEVLDLMEKSPKPIVAARFWPFCVAVTLTWKAQNRPRWSRRTNRARRTN